jgi:hypothetical protein
MVGEVNTMAQKITISPVTRIEGHAKITIHVDDAGKVQDSFFHVEQFRGFEKFSEGRMFYEMPQITPRTCGICPVSHHLASTKACDVIAGTTPTPTAHKLRELMHMGQMIQSHGMHFFELAGPDFIFGFDADPKIRHVGGIIQANRGPGDQGRQIARLRPGDHQASWASAACTHLRRARWRDAAAARPKTASGFSAAGRSHRDDDGGARVLQGLGRATRRW